MTRDTLRLSPLAALVFAAGALAPVKLSLFGEIYAAELALPFAALAALAAGGGRRVLHQPLLRGLLLALALTLAGYVLSDVIRGTRSDHYLRGWGRVGLVMSDFVALAILVCQDRRHLWWLGLGMGLGGIAWLRFVEHAPLAVWKFGYAEPMLLAATTLGALLPARLAAGWLGLLALASMHFDFRSFAAILFILAAHRWLRGDRPARPLAGGPRLWIAAVLAAAAILGALAITGNSAQARREASNAGRTAAFEVGLFAVANSPFIGYGSWTQNRELAERYLKRFRELRGGDGPTRSGAHFSPHSQVLQSWVEGGALGAAFFLALGWRTLRLLPWAALHRPMDALAPLMLYLLIAALWNLLMSPFGAPHRLNIALAAAVLVCLDMERRARAAQRRLARPAHAAGRDARVVTRVA